MVLLVKKFTKMMLEIAVNQMTDLEFGKALRRLRQEMGVKQEEVAMLSGYDQTEISRMERGNRSITVQALRGYTKAIGDINIILSLLESTLQVERNWNQWFVRTK